MSGLVEIAGCDNTDRKADIIFVHGLGGDAHRTWRHGRKDSTSWPHWLGEEFPEIGVWSLEYASSPSRWLWLPQSIGLGFRNLGHSMALPDRAQQVIDLLSLKEIGRRPLMFICHSLGGLLVKMMLRKAKDSTVPRMQDVAHHTQAVLFLATPHTGARLASWANAFKWGLGCTVSIEDLREHDASLRDLYDWYRNHSPVLGIKTFTYYETYKVKKVFLIVNATSAHPSIGADPVGLEEDHISIAKPLDRNAQVCDAARKILQNSVLAAGHFVPILSFESNTEEAKEALSAASANLLAWEQTLPNNRWMERPERESIKDRFHLATSSTVLLGEPGSGKSALLSRIASDLLDQGALVFALKADFLSTNIRTENDLQNELNLPNRPSDIILCLAKLHPIYVLIDQLDALASQLDLQSGRLNVLLNLVRRIGKVPNVHVLLSVRTFEFNHDVRLRAIEAEAVTLTLPCWNEVKEELSSVGINPDSWPEKARDVMRIPQALKTFITLVGSGQKEPFTTYQAMLEHLWNELIASDENSEHLITLASDIAGQMAEEETLWIAASRFDDRLNFLNRLEALGFIVRSENNLRVAFNHQTVFDYILARTFVRNSGLLSAYVLQRQDSLFVRAKVWSALNYLREVEHSSYEREFLKIWRTENLQRHLRFLLIEFLGQVDQPLEFERSCMTEVLNSPELSMFALKAIGSSSGWFVHYASTFIREAMSGTDPEAQQAIRLLTLNWKTGSECVIRLIEERWLPHPEKDEYLWRAIHHCPLWNDKVEEIAAIVLRRSPITIGRVEYTAMIVAVEQPEVALRLVREKLEFLLAEAKDKPEPPEYPVNGTEEEKTPWHIKYDPFKEFNKLLEATEWNDLPSLADAIPNEYLRYLWTWYVIVFSEILARKNGISLKHVYPGEYRVEFKASEAHPSLREKPVMKGLQIAIEEIAKKSPDEFLKWADENSNLEMMVVQQLIANGYTVSANQLASKALKWLLRDERRFQLGTVFRHRGTTIDLVQASAPYWSTDEIAIFEEAMRNYRPQVPDNLREPKDKKNFADMIRATKKDLLLAVGVERLSPKNQKLVVTEQRALGDRFDSSLRMGRGGFIGSPMETDAMLKAKDRDILKIFREIPDNTDWDHPKDWMRGGNIQLSRAFAELARTDPERAIRLIEQFKPLQQERAAGYALETMAEDASNDNRIIEAFLYLSARKFQTEEFMVTAASAINKVANRKANISNEVIDILIDWLSISPTTEEKADDEKIELDSRSNEGFREGGILWGYGHTTMLPGGNFNILSALASILLERKEAGRDRYFKILNDHLARERDPNIWKALLSDIVNAGGSTPQIVSVFIRNLFDRFPEILESREAIRFLAYAQRWDDKLVFDLISPWRMSDRPFLQEAYGELIGLVGIVKREESWVKALDDIITSNSDYMKIGLANAAVNLWSDEKFRLSAGEILVTLLKRASKDLVATIMDVFRVKTELVPDVSTVELLHSLADPQTDMSAAPSRFVVESFQALLPHEADLVATIAEKLVAAWRDKLGDVQTGTAFDAPQLSDLALTLHRLGGKLRQSGITLFETMIEIDAYGARDTLVEIDGRFDQQKKAVRQRLTRRRRSGSKSR